MRDIKMEEWHEKHTCGCIFNVSRQILPSLSMLGWYTGVVKRTRGGSNGYLTQTTTKINHYA